MRSYPSSSGIRVRERLERVEVPPHEESRRAAPSPRSSSSAPPPPNPDLAFVPILDKSLETRKNRRIQCLLTSTLNS